MAPPKKSDINAGNIKYTTRCRNKTVTLAVGPSKSPAGKGLGKAGARRLGRLLKRAIQCQGESSMKGDVSVPKTPVRLFKHQIRNTRANGIQINTPMKALPQISQLILSLVSQCRHNGGMTMAELKQTLATEGYVINNNKHVTVITKRLLNNEKLVHTKTNSSRLNNKQSEITLQKRTVRTRNKTKATATTQTTVPYQKPTAVKSKATGYTTKQEKTQTHATKILKRAKPERSINSIVKPKVKTQTRTHKLRIVKRRQKQNATKKRRTVPTMKKTTKTQKKRNSNKTTTQNQRPQKKQSAKHRKATSRT